MDAWDFSLMELAERGEPIVWGWALRRPPGCRLMDCCGIWHGFDAANDGRFAAYSLIHRTVVR